MCKIANVIVGICLMVAAYRDWKTKQISVGFLSLTTFLILLLRAAVIKDTLWSTLVGVGIGLCFFIISRVTREAIGYGDSWLILLLGIYLGGKPLLEVVFLASFAASLFSLFRGMVRGWNRGQTIPFVPFVFMAYLGVVFL